MTPLWMTFYSNHFFKIWKWSKTWIKVCYARYEWNSYWFRAHVSGKRGCLGAKVAPSGDASSHSSLARSSPFVSEQNGSDRTVYAFQIMPQLKEHNVACGARVLSEASLQRRPLWYSAFALRCFLGVDAYWKRLITVCSSSPISTSRFITYSPSGPVRVMTTRRCRLNRPKR